MSSAWRRWLVLAGAVGVGGALLFARRAPEEGSRAEARPASGPGAAASRTGATTSRASTPLEHVEAASSPAEPAVPSGASPGVEAPRSPADALAAASASPPVETLEEMEAREARERAAFAASLKTLPPMEYAKPPGPEVPPPSPDVHADPVAVQRHNQERLLQQNRAAVEGFTRDIQKEEGKLRRAEESGAPEELLARYRAKLELLRQGEAKFRAKVRLLESELGR